VTIPSADELAELLGPEPQPAPWLHQEKEYEEHRNDRCRVLLWTMRTGKSKAVIDKAEWQYAGGNIGGVILLAPNGIHLNWVLNEIPRWSWPENGQYMAFGWETPKRADWDQMSKLDALMSYRGGLRWFCVNMEALSHPDCIKAIRAFRRTCEGGRIMTAISEAHHFGRAGAKRTKLARNLANNSRFVMLETGTAILETPLKAYAIYKMLADDALGPEFTGDCYEKFAKRYGVWEVDERKTGRRRRFAKRTGYQNLDELKAKIAPWSSVVTRDQVVGMPDLLRTERIVVMSEAQRRAYLEMVSRHLVEIGDNEVSAIDAGARVQKLQQILNGYVKDGDNIISIDDEAPVYDALVDEVSGTLPENAIVWCRYHEDIRRVVARLKKEGIDVLEYHGLVPTGKREPIRLQFQNSTRPTVLVGHPAAGGEGKSFSRAHAIIFFSSTPRATHVAQGEERGTEKWGHPVTIVRFRTPGTVDDRNWDIVDGKITVADDIGGRGLRDLLMRTNV
jgi:Mesyanzhinovviridae DNA helicase